jgi:endo-beta-N-acetylglucosaminidase D
LFGAYPWDIDKKAIIQTKVAEIFPYIDWLYDSKGELKKENFDACDAYVACLGYLNKEKYGNLNITSSNIKIDENNISFQMNYWDKTKDVNIVFENIK